MLRSLLVFLFKDHALALDGSPVCTLQNSPLFQPLQITADCRLAGFQHFTKIDRPDDLVDCQIFLNSLSPLGWDERFAH
jgi:hypothetical protein